MDTANQTAPAEAPKLGILQPAPDGRLHPIVGLCSHEWVTEQRDYVAKFRDCSVTLKSIDHEVCAKCGEVEIADSTWRIIDGKLFDKLNKDYPDTKST
jgi:YgiT-type zinc finger domain-containing protein